MRLSAEKQACPRRRNPTALKTVLSCRQSERDGKAFWDAEQSDCHPPSCERTRIASQPLCPRKSRVCTLGTRKGRRRDGETGGGGRPDLDLDALMAHQLDACPSVVPTTPVTPENGFRPNHQWMQQHTHLARLLGCAALPLTLLAQGTGTATTDTGRIDHAQAPIGFSALLMGTKLLASGTAQRPIWLERKVLTREAARFPGQAHLRGSIARGRSRVQWDRRDGRSKLGGAQRSWLKLMAQLQAHVPDPLTDDVPGFLESRVHDYTSDPGPVRHLHQQAAVQKRHDAGRGPRHQRR